MRRLNHAIEFDGVVSSSCNFSQMFDGGLAIDGNVRQNFYAESNSQITSCKLENDEKLEQFTEVICKVKHNVVFH